jgi:hypothetical protein
MKHILQFILWKLRSKDFWLLVLGSFAMYLGWMLRANMRESIWQSYQQGPIGKSTVHF